MDLIVSSVMMPYLTAPEAQDAVTQLAAQLRPGGKLAFLELDIGSEALAYAKPDVIRRVYGGRDLKLPVEQSLVPLLRNAGLEVEPVRRHVWRDTQYTPYLQHLFSGHADALRSGRINASERRELTRTLDTMKRNGTFRYAIRYDLVTAKKPERPVTRRSPAPPVQIRHR